MNSGPPILSLDSIWGDLHVARRVCVTSLPAAPRWFDRCLLATIRARSSREDFRVWSCVPSELLEGGVAKHQPLDPSAAKVDLGLGLVARASQPDHRAEAPRVVRDAITRL